MLMSADLLVCATWHTANCAALAILIGTYQLVNDIHACRGNACVRICTPLEASMHETDANSELQRYTAELQAELHFRHRVWYSSGWIASPAIRDCLSWQLILWHLLLLKPMLNDYSHCMGIWQQENRTELGCPCTDGYFWNWTIILLLLLLLLSHSALDSMYCELKCNLIRGIVEEQRKIRWRDCVFFAFAELLSH